MKRIYVLAFTGTIMMMVLQSCASIFGGRTHSLVFCESNTPEAQVFIDDTLKGNAEGKLVLPKGTIQHGSKLEIRAEGYETQEYIILLKPQPAYVVADFAFGAVPLIFDFANGNILRPVPRKFEVVLEKSVNHPSNKTE